MIAMAPVQQKNKKYDLKFKISVVKYAEENTGEAAARCFSVDPKIVRHGRKNQTELQRLSEEDSSRARLPAGGRKKANEEPEINMRGWVAVLIIFGFIYNCLSVCIFVLYVYIDVYFVCRLVLLCVTWSFNFPEGTSQRNKWSRRLFRHRPPLLHTICQGL